MAVATEVADKTAVLSKIASGMPLGCQDRCGSPAQQSPIQWTKVETAKACKLRMTYRLLELPGSGALREGSAGYRAFGAKCDSSMPKAAASVQTEGSTEYATSARQERPLPGR